MIGGRKLIVAVFENQTHRKASGGVGRSISANVPCITQGRFDKRTSKTNRWQSHESGNYEKKQKLEAIQVVRRIPYTADAS